MPLAHRVCLALAFAVPLIAAVCGRAGERAPARQPRVVKLGEGELLTGIPGEGPLTLEEVRAWLDDPANHAELAPILPMGLAAGQHVMVGLDENPLTRAKIELGRQLFFDPRLSRDGTVSCASCHDPAHGYAFDTRFGVGVDGQQGTRNSPAAYNRILSAAQFWDGRAESLEAQAVAPMTNPLEMANTHEVVVETCRRVRGYRMQFRRLFSDGVTIDNVGRALACFERALVTGPTPWDYHAELQRFERGYSEELEEPEFFAEDEPEVYQEYLDAKQAAEAHPLGESAQRGGELFFSDVSGCTQCHVGPNFTDELYHNLGVGMDAPPGEIDWGRYAVTGDDADRGAFKTPTLRNVAQTAPYMHDGSQETLEEVVEWYVDGGHPNPHLSDKVQKLDLTEQQQADLVAFMKALTGPLPEVETGRLPE